MLRCPYSPPRSFAAVCLVLAFAGCGTNNVPQPIDTAEAGRHLEAALKSWKADEPYSGLADRSPSIVFNEPLWQDGAKLLSYDLEPVELQGRQGRSTAKLTLKDKAGKQYERRIGYVIDTVPRIVIVRENLGL